MKTAIKNTRKKNSHVTLNLLKERQEDFEWYPTTDEMIAAVFRHCGNFSSLLDIGAGDGRVLEQISKLCERRAEHSHNCARIDKYAIEMSLTHLENMPPDISVVGTDFRAQTLIDKKVDVIFSNPPYAEYEDWSTHIIKEANAKTVFLILPARWSLSKVIQQAVTQRKAWTKVIWTGDFLEGDRRSRAKVEIVKVTITDADRGYERQQSDPFDVWFDEHFAGFQKLTPAGNDDDARYESPKLSYEILPGQNLIERLSELYARDMKELLGNYKSLSELNVTLLKELGVSVPEIRNALKQKIEGLKNIYWQELFNNLDKVTSRLTSKSRKSMLDKLHASCTIDFSVENAYALVLWVIKNANQYLERQVTEIFKELSEPDCVKNYKSNLKTWEKDGWRYQKNHTRYTLDYRIVTNRWNAIVTKDSFRSWENTNGLHNDSHDFIGDIMTVANNLGFASCQSSRTRLWEAGAEQRFYAGDHRLLFVVRAYKNGNLHFKFDQDLIKTLNIEASRLLGWIRTPKEAADEMDLDLDFVTSRFNTNLFFGTSDGRKLLTACSSGRGAP